MEYGQSREEHVVGDTTTYTLGPDSHPQEGVPHGTLTAHQWESTVFRDTIRAYEIYVPSQYDAGSGASLMVFQDGAAYSDPEGHFRVPTVFDNLIHEGTMPPTIGLFVNPGHEGELSELEEVWDANNRGYEYDRLGDLYATFLMTELIPEIEKTYTLVDDPKHRAICGISSGGIAAFTAAWEHPEYFHKVLSHVGSFTNLRGGHVYPGMIRNSAPRDIRVFLQDGSNDLNIPAGDWWLSNLQMDSALRFRGYDCRFEGGTGGHDGKHGGAILPESLRWLWRDWKETV